MKTLVIVKPGFKQYPGLLFGIGSFIYAKRWDTLFNKTVQPPREFWEKLYSAQKDQPFFEEMIRYLISSWSIGIIIEGDDVVRLMRVRAVEIRARHGKSGKVFKDIVHSSENDGDAEREVNLFIEFLSRGRL